jgi:hypothetical protein
MDITLVHALEISSCFGLLLLINSLPLTAHLVRHLTSRTSGRDIRDGQFDPAVSSSSPQHSR